MAKVPAVVERYWQALEAGDGPAMAACYAKKAEFQDEVFKLSGEDAGRMWRMLFTPGGPVKVTTGELTTVDGITTGRWEAVYEFTMTGRMVHNKIDSTFTVAGGKIVAQRDRFPFWKWSRMALGTKGLLLGWTPLVRRAVQKTANRRLAKFDG